MRASRLIAVALFSAALMVGGLRGTVGSQLNPDLTCTKADSTVTLRPPDRLKPPSSLGLMSLYLARSTGILALVVVLLAALLLAVRGLNLAVEFTGGMIIQVHYPERPETQSVQDTLVRAGLAGASVKNSINEYTNFVIFPPKDEVLSPQSARHVVQQVIAALSTERRHVEATRVDIVTPTVGREVLLTGVASLSLVCIAISIYQAVRYGWTVTMTNIRNIMIVLGLSLSVYVVFQWEFSLRSLAAMGCLPILVTGAGAVYASRVGRS